MQNETQKILTLDRIFSHLELSYTTFKELEKMLQNYTQKDIKNYRTTEYHGYYPQTLISACLTRLTDEKLKCIEYLISQGVDVNAGVSSLCIDVMV